MKKSIKRILCGALSVALCSTLVAESVLRLNADNAKQKPVVAASASFTNVTGKYDTSKLRESFFNDSVLKSEDIKPVYETRTVMVTLSKAPIADRSGSAAIGAYKKTWSGEMAKSEIDGEQTAFLQALSKKGIPYKVEHTYDTLLNAVAIEIDTKYVSEIKKMKGVDSAVITTAYAEPKTVKSGGVVVTNETDVYETGIYDSTGYSQYGEGMVVAVLDTGLDYTHSAFQGFESTGVEFDWTRDKVKGYINTLDLEAEKKSGGSLDVSQVYMNDKVPFAYDYADDDPDVYPSYSNHGTHVAGIIGGYDPNGYTDKDGNPITDKEFLGVVPDAQLMICKVFTDDLDDPDLGGAVSEDIVAALEDCVTLGVDVINMSLGSSCGFTTTNDGDDEGEMLNKVYSRIGEQGVSLICAASNDYSAGYGGVYGTNLATNPDSGTVGSPSTFASALSVASINGQKADYLIANPDGDKSFVFFEESRDINSNPFDFVKDLQTKYPENRNSDGTYTFEYVVVPGVGHAADYTATIKDKFKSGKRLAVVKRGDTTFKEKIEIAMEMGAIGVIIYNNVAGVIRMNLGEIENPVPSVSISMNAGTAMVNGATNLLGKFTVDESYSAGPFMSEFSSWGPTPDLKLKPEITAHGGEITSAVPGGYGEQSGTSMATPNMAGFMAIVRSYIEKDLAEYVTELENAEIARLEAKKGEALTPEETSSVRAVVTNRLAMQLTMSTAGMVKDQDGLPYSPRKQGAGVAKLGNVVSGTKAYLWTDVESNDYRPKVELGDDPDKEGVYVLNFNVTNFGATDLTFQASQEFMTETLSSDQLTVSEQARMLTDSQATWKVDGKAVTNGEITVPSGETKKIQVTLEMGEADKAYIEKSFANGMYVEGFARLLSETSGQCDLTLPFLGFYGDWNDAPMLDYSAYEVADNAQDSTVKEEDKIKASVWETQPFNIYYNDKYILPMGGYLYLLPDDAEPMYVDEEHNSVSRYNEYYGEGEVENYMTTTGIKAVYAGLLRNARVVTYKLYDEETGEILIGDGRIDRVSKAYSGGGSTVPANVELELIPETAGLVGNGRYRMEFEFFKDDPADDPNTATDTFEFSFTVDYEAPVMQDARVRYYNYKEGNKEKQRIYLDIDVYDNHYAQTLMLCYPKTADDGDVSLQISTEYPTPIRNAVRNGVTTVSVEITDIYEKYGDQMYVQIDDYALNTCLYQIDITKANANMLPDGDAFALTETSVELDIYQTHKAGVVFAESYKGNGDKSNLLWTSSNPRIAEVKNGEIVGLSEGTAKITVNNRKGVTKTMTVKVSGTVSKSLVKVPSVSFGVIQTDTDSLQKADGGVKVNAGKTIKMSVLTDPWYHPMTDLQIKWASSNEGVATVDDNGVVKTLKKGTAIISATVMQKNRQGVWTETLYKATSIMQVQNEFDVENYTLNDYNGIGYNAEDGYELSDGVLKIPDDMNVMYIGAEAFKDNDNIRVIVIPESVTEIRERAFLNCTALEEVYFVSTKSRLPNEPAKADVSMIYENAFEGCTKLRKVDFSHVKTTTIAQGCFAGCTSLAEVVDMPSIGTMHHLAFAGTALTSVDLSGLHMSGQYVFKDCKKLETVVTGQFTAIGDYMFEGCTGLQAPLTLSTPKIGVGAFKDCVNLSKVILDDKGKGLAFDIGANAFENCGTGIKTPFSVETASGSIRSIGDLAFAGSTLASFDFNGVDKLEVLGENAFTGTKLTTIALTEKWDIAALRMTGIPFEGLTVTVDGTPDGNGFVANAKYKEKEGVIYSADGKTLVYVNDAKTGEFTLPAGVETIEDYAFANSNLSKVTLASSVTALGTGSFQNARIQEIDFNGATVSVVPASAFKGSLLQNVSLTGVTEIGASAFAFTALSTFQAATGLHTIGSNAFEGCTALHSVTLPDGVKTMGDRVFAGCTSLKTMAMPSVETLGEYTFEDAGLERVTFGNNAQTVGTYTFVGTPIGIETKNPDDTVTYYTVDLSNITAEEFTALGAGVFYGCTDLTNVKLPAQVTKIDDLAFSGCKKLQAVEGIEQIAHFGVRSFYNAGLKSLKLTSAEKISIQAFASFEELGTGKKQTGAYTSVTLGDNVKTIGDYAFYNGGMSSVALPATLQKVGIAAFASADNLSTITVDGGNPSFFTEDNVLYRKVNAEEYELVCYPTARAEEEVDGYRTYEIKEGTVRVLAYSFYNLNSKALTAVVLPYSVNTVGDSAFFESGIVKYVFESIKAPTLEAEYRSDVRDVIKEQSSIAEYKGYYNTNFQTYLYKFTKYGGEKSTYIMHYPSNGTGYDNPIYSIYFGTKIASENPLMEDNTRECIKLVNGMPTASEVSAWASKEKTDENKEEILAFAETVKTARIYYNNAMANAGQKPFVTAEVESKLLDVEKALRAVKTAFGIKPVIKQLLVSAESTHKTNYLVGEKFDMNGLAVIVEYDDYSREDAKTSELRLLTTGELSVYNNYVEVQYAGKKVEVAVTVTDPTTAGTDNEEKDDSTFKKVVLPIIIVVAGLAVAGGVGVLVFFGMKKGTFKRIGEKLASGKRGKSEEASSEQSDEETNE